MTINGLKLPDAFVALIDRPKPLILWDRKGEEDDWIYKGGVGGLYWIPRGDVDLEDDDSADYFLLDLRLFESLDRVERETNRLPITFHVADYLPEEVATLDAGNAHRPGFLPFITDFSKLVYFGNTVTGEAYCFDYRENADEPSIVHWNDAYWRRFAPNFDAFMSLFEPWIDPRERGGA